MTKTEKKEPHLSISPSYILCATTDRPIQYIHKQSEKEDSLKISKLIPLSQMMSSEGWTSTITYSEHLQYQH